MTVILEKVPLGGKHCDFCSVHSIWKTYPCRNFECCGRPVFGSAPTGSWASCQACSELVDGREWDRLVQRAVYRFLAKHEVVREQIPTLWAQFTQIQQDFAEHVLTHG